MKQKGSDTTRWAWLILGPVLLLLALVLPAPEGMTPEAMKLVGVTGLMAVWWLAEVVNLAVVAMIPLVAFPLLGIQQAQPTAQAYADQNIFLFMGGLLLATAMQRWGLHRRMAIHVLYLLGSRPKGLVLGFMVATAFLSMWISNTATAVMMLPIAVSVVLYVTGKKPEEVRGQKGEERNFSLALMLGIAYGASIGGMATLVGTPPNAIMFGSGCLDIPTMAKTGIAVNLLGLILITLLTFTFGVRVLDISPGLVPLWAVP